MLLQAASALVHPHFGVLLATIRLRCFTLSQTLTSGLIVAFYPSIQTAPGAVCLQGPLKKLHIRR